MFIAKTYVPTLFVAICTGVGLIVFYTLMAIPLMLKNSVVYLGKHSSNIWLTHMFLYMSIGAFSRYVYLTRNPLIIFSTLLFMCILFSYFINYVENKFQRIGAAQHDSNT
jgi:hypothetical protein